MASILNSFDQPIGLPLPGWIPPPVPPEDEMTRRYCRLELLSIQKHAEPLYRACTAEVDQRAWTYLPYGPFSDFKSYEYWLITSCLTTDPLFFAIIDQADGQPVGLASYLRINPDSGSIEVGHIHYSPRLKHSAAATEAMFLMMQKAFDLGYRRYEWKCDSLNAPSRAAAQRLGFTYEGLFRQATVYKGRTRDTAWYSIIDSEWPRLKAAFQTWLAPENFDEQGRQKSRLS